MAIYTGIDASMSCTGLALVEYLPDEKMFNLVDKKSITPNKKKKGFDKSIESLGIFRFILETYSSYSESSFFIFENYSYGSPGKLADLGELTGLYKYEITQVLKKPYDTIPPQSVKKIITGSGRASKEDLLASLPKFVKNIDQFNFSNYDESDAVAVAVAYGLKMSELI